MIGWDNLNQLFERARGDYSLCIWDTQGREYYAYRAAIQLPSASLIKLPLAMVVYDAAAAGHIDLDQQLLLARADQVEGDGSLDRELPPEGRRLSVRRLIEHALIESDNTAANQLIRLVGMQTVNQWLVARGCLATRLQRRFMDFEAVRAGRQNWTTARDMCRILLITQEQQYAEVRSCLSRAGGNDRLAAGLPPGTPLAHKWGDLPGIEHDAGLIELAGGTLAVAALSEGLPSAAEGKRTLAAAARLICKLLAGADE